MTQLIGEIKRLEQSWSAADAQIHSTLRQIGTSLPGPGLLRDIGFQIGERVPDLQRRLDLIVSTQKIGLDRGVTWADETLWPSSSPASGAAVAKSLADQLRQARRDGETAPNRETLDLLEKHKHDPYFAVAFAKEMPAQELKALLKDLYAKDPYSRDRGWKDPPASATDRLAAALSVTLGTASRGVGDMRLPKGYADELIASEWTAPDNDIIDKLLRYGTFDDAFLRDIANKVFDNARKPASEQQKIVGFGPGLAAALARNPKVAQDFFTDPVRQPLAFLMRDNYWGEGNGELGRAIEAATTTFRDHGQQEGGSRGYKSALIASWAVHFWADPKVQARLPDTRQNAARIFSAYMSDVHRVANSGVSEPPGVTRLPDTDMNLPGRQPHGAMFDRDALRQAMAWTFTDTGALKTVLEGHGEYSMKIMDAEGAAIREKIDTAFSTWQKSHPSATQAEQDAYRQQLLTQNLTTAPKQLFDAKIHTLSKTLSFVVDAGNLTSINEADENDQRRKAFNDAVGRTLKLALTPAGDAVVAGYEFVEANVSDHLKYTEGDTARSKGEETLRKSQDLFTALTADAMLRHELFGKATTPGSTHPHAFENYAKSSGGDFLASGKIIPLDQMNSTQAGAYDEWLKHSDASGVFNETAISVWRGFQLDVPPYPKAAE
ncbi:hypothetical protein ACIBKY_21830 [Nonomuraea sp. NPDC050394]|uniref:hypothetical protein n=1 Tax=Nonomuraea sp. NPDC050394 TaxID=3364363 RepID=UPI0037B2855D